MRSELPAAASSALPAATTSSMSARLGAQGGVSHNSLGADAAGGDGEAVEGHVPAELLPARAQQRRLTGDLDGRVLPEREGEVELGGVVAEVRDADLAVLDVVDDTRFASVDAGEGEPAEDAFRAERGGEPLLDAEAVHDGEHARLGREAGADKGGCVVKSGGLEAAEHPVDGADGGRPSPSPPAASAPRLL